MHVCSAFLRTFEWMYVSIIHFSKDNCSYIYFKSPNVYTCKHELYLWIFSSTWKEISLEKYFSFLIYTNTTKTFFFLRRKFIQVLDRFQCSVWTENCLWSRNLFRLFRIMKQNFEWLTPLPHKMFSFKIHYRCLLCMLKYIFRD